MAAQYSILEILQKVWEWANEKLTSEKINNNLLLATYNEGRAVLHMAVKGGRLELLRTSAVQS